MTAIARGLRILLFLEPLKLNFHATKREEKRKNKRRNFISAYLSCDRRKQEDRRGKCSISLITYLPQKQLRRDFKRYLFLCFLILVFNIGKLPLSLKS